MSDNMILNFLLRYVVIILFYTNYNAVSRLRFGGVSPGAAAFLALFYALGTLQYVKQLVAIYILITKCLLFAQNNVSIYPVDIHYHMRKSYNLDIHYLRTMLEIVFHSLELI
jgi:ABC-type maltose transport system permease subunit